MSSAYAEFKCAICNRPLDLETPKLMTKENQCTLNATS
jgi:hypothetical protein